MNKTPKQIRKNNNKLLFNNNISRQKRNQLRLKSEDNCLHDKLKNIQNFNQRSQDNIFNMIELNSSMTSYDNFIQANNILN